MRNQRSASTGRDRADQAVAAWLFGERPGSPSVTGLDVEPVTRPDSPRDQAGTWLRLAGLALGLLALAAAAVSYKAQYDLIFAYKNERAVSYIQAGIPDVGALVFGCLGVALAVQGKRALRARTLNVACVGLSIGMNALAASSGWSATAVWVMAPSVYALASDTLIGVVRSYAIARQKRLNEALTDEGITPLQVVGAMLLWLLRLSLAPVSTLRGFRRWVISLPSAPRQREIRRGAEPPAEIEPPKVTVIPPKRPNANGRGSNSKGRRHRGGKADALIKLASDRHDLTTIEIKKVSAIATGLAPEAHIHPATARRVLLGHVRELQNGNGS